MDDYEIAEIMRAKMLNNKNKVIEAAKKYGYKKIHTDAEMASVKVYIGGGSVYINGNGRDGRQTVFVAPNDADLLLCCLTLRMEVIFV